MTLQQLEYVIAVDKYRHFVRAAESCGVTQSTLSSMIRKLEEELDVVIFDRNAHPVQPTMAGEQVVSQAKVVLFNARQLQEMTLNERKRVEGGIRMGITPTIAPYIVPKMFSFVRRNYPGVSIRAKEMNYEAIVRKLKKTELDMAIMALATNDDDLLAIPLYRERLVAYISPNDPLYQQSEICSRTLPCNRVWTLKHEICFQNQVPTFCDGKTCMRQTSAYESGCMSALVMIVDENGGFTVMPELHISLLRESMRNNIRPLVDPVPTREISLYVRKDYVREGLLNVVADAVGQIIPEHMLDPRLGKFRIRL